MTAHLPIQHDAIRAFCEKWGVMELALFGSVLRDDFRPDSDAEVLASFKPDSQVSYRHWPDMIAEPETIFGRKVDLVEKQALRNPFRRSSILRNHEVVYAA